jgi:hypothetical protein
MNPNSTGNGASDAAAALKGASLAFQKNIAPKKTKPAPPPTGAKPTEVLATVTSASRDQSRSRSPIHAGNQRLSGQVTGGSIHEGHGYNLEHSAVSQKLSQYLSNSPASGAYLHPSGRQVGVDPKSPSFIAATLATSRSASPTPRNTSPGNPATYNSQLGHRLKRRGSLGAASISSTMDLPDTSSIPPTTSLISMFEDRKSDVDPIKRSDQPPSVRRVLKATHSPLISSSTNMVETEPSDVASARNKPHTKPKPKTAPKPRVKTPPPAQRQEFTQILEPHQSRDLARDYEPPRIATPKVVSRSTTEIVAPEPRRIASRPKLRPPTPPQPRGSSSRTKIQSGTDHVRSRRSIEVYDGHGSSTVDSAHPLAPVARRPTILSTSSDDTFVSASSVQSPERLSPPPPILPRRKRASSTRSVPSSPVRYETPPRRNPTTASSSNLPLHSLTNAMMAGSIAASRLTPSNTGNSALSPGPPLPQRQKSPRLKQTLRQPASLSDDERERRKKKHHNKLGGSGKHSHHEGSRRRWREEITDRERKRYEAVWASNRGLMADFLTNTEKATATFGEDLSQYVLDIVVRHIWQRSRLPDHELEEVWSLVDSQKKRRLSKEEFVVGMWLIDQRLRGRKIPLNVSSSVWDSVRVVRVPNPKKR